MRRLGCLVGLLMVALAAMGGCAPRDEADLQLSPRVVRPDVGVVVFFVDGLDNRHLQEQLAAGALPEIQRHFVESGVRIRHAVTSLPPITYPNAVSIITGLFPGHHGVLGNQWFDREALLLRDYGSASSYQSVNNDFRAPTLYELLADRFTVNVQCHTRRGVKETIDHKLESGLDWFLENYDDTDERVGQTVEQVAGLARRWDHWPSVYFNYFPGIDEIGHRYGPDSAEYRRALCVVDSAVGRIAGAVEAVKPAAHNYYILLTDHSHVQVGEGRTVDITDRLAARYKLRVARGGDGGTNRPGWRGWNQYDAVVVVGAYRRVAIHLRGRGGWDQPPDKELLASLLDATDADGLVQSVGVDLVCARTGAGVVRVSSRHGSAVIERRIVDAKRQYRLNDPANREAATMEDREPFGYGSDPVAAAMLDGKWHDSRHWLAATAHTDYPDFVPQVMEMFDSRRAGDVVVFAAEDYSFDRTAKGSHGAALASDMEIPMYFSGPGLPAGGVIECARLVDVMPTILELLGADGRLATSAPIDGISLVAELRSADRTAP